MDTWTLDDRCVRWFTTGRTLKAPQSSIDQPAMRTFGFWKEPKWRWRVISLLCILYTCRNLIFITSIIPFGSEVHKVIGRGREYLF